LFQAGFTLIELLVVIGVMALIMALAVPAYNSIGNGANLTKSVYDLEGILDEARTYAMANNTFVWVGVLEENGGQPSPSTPLTSTSGLGGRVIVSVVASRDGTRYSDDKVDAANPPAFGMEPPSASPQLNQVQLVQVDNLLKLNNTHLATLNQAQNGAAASFPTRPGVAPAYQVGDPTFAQHAAASGAMIANPTTFTYPLTVNQKAPANLQYTFSKIIEFDPRGEASKIDENTFSGPGPQAVMEFGIQPAHGNIIDSRYTGANATHAAAVAQIEGISGKVRIFWP
jgi:prepilin-type N-terminal cleavage/methylation domain-containing protein